MKKIVCIIIVLLGCVPAFGQEKDNSKGYDAPVSHWLLNEPLCLLASVASADERRVVLNDPGGSLWTHTETARKYRDDGTKLEVAYCASACLIVLAIVPRDRVCFRRSAWIGYHSANYVGGGETPDKMHWERGADWIARGYAKC